jgi:hypothetical protein
MTSSLFMMLMLFSQSTFLAECMDAYFVSDENTILDFN